MEHQLLTPLCEDIALHLEDIIEEAGRPVQFLYFPIDSAISMTNVQDHEHMVEVLPVTTRSYIERPHQNIFTREGFMMTSKVVRMSSGGTVLVLGLFTMLPLSDVAFAATEMKRSPCDIPPGQNAMRAEENLGRGTHIISGELIGMDGDYYVVKDERGNEVSLLSDKRTDKPVIEKGDRITAYVDDQNTALWIRSNESTDRRDEHASVDCNPD